MTADSQIRFGKLNSRRVPNAQDDNVSAVYLKKQTIPTRSPSDEKFTNLKTNAG